MNNEIEAESKTVVNEYRCTRAELYMHECIGEKDVSAREGHYVICTSAEEAQEEMKRRYPNERSFTVELWKKNVYTYTVLTVE
jgi:hypothetical protein